MSQNPGTSEDPGARRSDRPIWRRAARHLAPLVLPRWTMLLVAALALITGVAFDLLKPWPLKFVFDYLLKGVTFLPAWAQMPGMSETTWMLAVICAMIVAAAAISSSAAYCREFLLNRVGEELAFELRGMLFRHVQRLGLAFHDSSRLGDTITRITDDTRSIRELATTSVLQVATALVSVAGMLGTMVLMDATLALVGILAVGIVGPMVWYYKRRIERASRQRRTREGELTSVAQETMSSIRLVKTLGREAHQQKAFGLQSSESAQIGLEVARLEAAYVRSVDFAVALVTCAVVWLGVHRVWAGNLQIGDLYVFAYYVKNLYGPLRDLAKQSSKIAKGKVGLERVIDLLEEEPAVVESPRARPAPRFSGRIAFEGVGFEYAAGRTVLRDVAFRIEPGERIALVGHSGAGKSTILSLLSRLYDPTAGRILLDGHDLRDLQLATLRDQISVVLQDSILLQTSIRENILYGRDGATDAEVAAAAAAAGVDLFIGRLPDGYDTVVGQRGATLSGGERQRVAIARAIVRNAPILLLDEPTTGLDAKSEQLVMRGLARLMEGRTTVLVSHKLGLIERADRILVIDGGRLVESGTHAELLRAGGLYAQVRATALESDGDGSPPSRLETFRPERPEPTKR
ncbi:MAG TPA: ABC transporter ATP-binding protein [Planctomycetota bacterium]|jgi:ABC-type multidrug transport system fused ATPase/permease subunit|nr:ABC transporter ATP-binding protein [Planctomycetota bacterium]